MHALTAPEMLSVWERGQTQPPVQRVLTLLATGCPESTPDVLAELSIGQRDARLLTLREWSFGPQLVCLATCPGCCERLELTFNVSDIRATPEAPPEEVLSLKTDDYELRLRLPNSLDLAVLAEPDDMAVHRQRLLSRCLLEIRYRGSEISADQLPADVMAAAAEQMAQSDPQADVQLALCCPACGHQWRAVFDIVSFFWSEITAWAQQILREVHVLASAYGWSEAEILSLSPWRRQLYLQMVSG